MRSGTGVREAAVIGVPDEYRGETVKAFISPRAGSSVTPDELFAFTREPMAAHKYPRSVVIMGELPGTVTGKILRHELRPTKTRSGYPRPQKGGGSLLRSLAGWGFGGGGRGVRSVGSVPIRCRVGWW